MAARRLREPVVQMREMLAVAKVIEAPERRVEILERIMLARGMKADDARRRLMKGLTLAAGVMEWDFELAWSIGWLLVYWPHRKDERAFEEECLRVCRREFELAWNGLPTRLEGLRAALEALDDARDESDGHVLMGALVA